MKRSGLVVVFVLLVAASAAAQSPIHNPTSVTWDHPDFASAVRYEGGYFAYPVVNGACDFAGTPATSPLQVDDLGKPATTTGLNLTANLGARPKGCYGYRVRAFDASGLASDWSDMGVPLFYRKPIQPNNVVPK